VVLKWKATPGVKSYHVQIAREATFSEVVLDQKVDEPVVKWEALPSTTFYWRVRSFDADGRASEWSAPRQIARATTAPPPLSPDEGATLACSDSPTELTLEPSTVLKEYVLLLSPDHRFPAADTQTLRGATNVFEVQLTPGPWSWKGQGVDLNGKPTEDSKPRKLNVRLGAPKPKAPADVAAGTAQVSLTWSRTPCAKRYIVEAWHETAERATLEANDTGLSFKAAGLGEYRFRVAAKDEKGNQSEWSAEASFKVRLPAPTAAQEVIGPQVASGHEVELSWTAAPQAEKYVVEVTAGESFNRGSELSVNGTVARMMLRPGRYQWRVSGRDAQGRPSFPTEIRKFSVVDSRLPPESVGMLFPVDNAVLDRPIDGMLGVAWSNSPGAIGYELEVDGETRAIEAPPTRVEFGDGEHTLRVRAQGANGLFSSWSDTRRFSFGSLKSSHVEVTFDPEPLRCDGHRKTKVELRLTDPRGRKVRGFKPELTVDTGTLGEPREELDSWVVEWTSPTEAPSSGRGTLTVKERAFSDTAKVKLVSDFPTFTLSASAGGRFNGSTVVSPAGLASFAWRALTGSGRFTMHLRAGFYRASTPGVEVLLPGLSVLAGVQLDFGPWSGRALLGPGGQIALSTVGLGKQVNALPSAEAALAVSRRLGGGALEFEVSYLYGLLETSFVKLQAGGLFVGIGYRLDLPGGS
jgi:hypothetical protein